MSLRPESAWVALLDSGRWRRIARSRLGSRVRSSTAYRSADLARRYTDTKFRCRRDPTRFSEVGTLCLFLGPVKSGGTLIGSLLDAHPDALVSDEVDVLKYVKAGFSGQQIFHVIAKGSRREAMKGRVTARRLDPYSLAVPGLTQGRSEHVRLMGDTRAGPTTRQIGDDQRLLDDLDRTFAPVGIRFVQVVRNPFDPISAMIRRGRRSFSNAINDYEQQCRRLVQLRAVLDPCRVHTVRYESFTSDPIAELTAVCGFLGLSATRPYLATATSIVKPNWRRERSTVEWSAEAIESVERLIDSVPFLEGYRWD